MGWEKVYKSWRELENCVKGEVVEELFPEVAHWRSFQRFQGPVQKSPGPPQLHSPKIKNLFFKNAEVNLPKNEKVKE